MLGRASDIHRSAGVRGAAGAHAVSEPACALARAPGERAGGVAEAAA